jgi:hypothetical protein
MKVQDREFGPSLSVFIVLLRAAAAEKSLSGELRPFSPAGRRTG